MLLEKYPIESVAADVVARADFRPFPTIEERAPWETLPADLRVMLMDRAWKYLGFGWPMLPMVRYLDYTRTGNRSNYEALYYTRRFALGDMVVAECLEGGGRFIDDIVNGIWCICEESTWCIPASNWVGKDIQALPDTQQPFVELFSAETGALLSLTHYLLRSRLDAVNPRICERIRREVKTRILDPYMEREHWWMGFGPIINNWTVWCNSNALLASLLLDDDHDRRVATVARAMRIADNFINAYPKDGGCDEGPTYWNVAGGSLFDCLEHLSAATRGKIDVYGEPLIREIAKYIVRAHISGNYMTNLADGSPRAGVNGDLVYRFGKRIGDVGMMGFGAHAFHENRCIAFGFSLNRVLVAAFNWAELDAAKGGPAYLRDVWMPGIEVMAAREKGGSDRGLYLAVKGGHNNESHNHNDVGHFMLYSDGKPFLIDAGVGAYTKQTFSAQRYELWFMQSQYHNVPTVNGVQQNPGAEFRATDVSYAQDDTAARLSMNIASAYPADAGIVRWTRAFSLTRSGGSAVDVTDDFELAKPSSDITMNLLTPCQADVAVAGAILLRDPGGDRVRLEYDAAKLSPKVETIDIDDPVLAASWGNRLYRVVLRSTGAASKHTWRMRFTKVAPAR